MACGIYISVASLLMTGIHLESAVHSGISRAIKYYRKQEDFQDELKYFIRIEDNNFKDLAVEEIKSSGYVVDTLEAAIWFI